MKAGLSKKISTIENKFFSIVQYLVFAVALIAFLVFLFVGITAISNLMTSANTNIKTTKTTVKEYISEKEQEAKEIKKEEEARKKADAKAKQQPKKDVKPEKMVEPTKTIYDKIADNFTTYAKKHGSETTANAEGIENYISNQMGWHDEEVVTKYLDQLLKASVALTKVKFSKDETPIEWIDYFNWQHEKFIGALEEEVVRIEMEEIKAGQDKVAALQKLPIIFGGLITFFLFTLILVLIRIEKNTRQVHVSEKDIIKEASTN